MINLINYLFDIEGTYIKKYVSVHVKENVQMLAPQDMRYKDETANILIDKLLKETNLDNELQSKRNVNFTMTIVIDEMMGEITITLSYKGVTSKVGYQR